MKKSVDKARKRQQYDTLRRQAERTGVAEILSGGCAVRITNVPGIVVFFPVDKGRFKKEVYDPLNALRAVKHYDGTTGEIDVRASGRRFEGVVLDESHPQVEALFEVDTGRMADATEKRGIDIYAFPNIGLQYGAVSRDEAARKLYNHFRQLEAGVAQ